MSACAEDMVPCEDGQGVYSGEVDIVEALGEVTLLYFGKEGVDNAVIAKLPGIHTGLRHQTIALKAAPDKIISSRMGARFLPLMSQTRGK